MILFHDDWYTQKAIPHISTKNKSFLKMHVILKKMGIKNNSFFLALHDKDLESIDPHKLKDPSTELGTRINMEITRNPWYFVREIVRVPASSIDPIPFQLNRANLFLLWSFYNSVSIFLIEPRQTGKTITMATIINHLMYFLYKKTNIFLYAKDNGLIYDNVDRVKSIRDELPKFLIKRQPTKDTENKKELYYAKRETKLQTKAAQNSISSAFNAGRGQTFLPLLIDEGPFCANIDISYPVMMNASNKSRMFARENSIPFGNIFITTAGVLDTKEGKYTFDIMTKACFFTEDLYDCKSNTELKYVISKNSINKMLYGEFSLYQLGYDDNWIKETAAENNLTDAEIKRDLLNQWTSGTNFPVVPPEIIEKMDTHKEHPVTTETVDGYVFRWYEKPEEVFRPDRYFMLGLDTSENIGNDYTTCHLLDVSDLSTIMTSRCNDQDLLKLAEYISKFLIAHPNVTLVPENKSTAAVLIPIIIKELISNRINPFTRIFNKIVQNRQDPVYSKMDISDMTLADGPYKKFFGFRTSGSGEMSRDSLYKLTLKKALTASATKIRDITLIQEIRNLTLGKGGRIDHAVSGNDDAVISFLLCAWATYYGKNLSVYGIPIDNLLSKVTPSGEEINLTLRARKRDLKRRLSQLKDKIDGTTHLAVKSSLQREYRALEDELSREFGNVPDEIQTLETHSYSKKGGMSDRELYQFLGSRSRYAWNTWNI